MTDEELAEEKRLAHERGIGAAAPVAPVEPRVAASAAPAEAVAADTEGPAEAAAAAAGPEATRGLRMSKG